ncbi:MAG TPA: bifunctional UDP-N-acetylglucosamine diphosphorylase/glucosamine-1-phosphate N-acetyltransferase GlmU [Bryobacteraceae bacterium]|nr:bifunctional UDP-N-acetylglucosamine diphosphorylase/glucosamine-1-phosphate N-acetyltransferase GlmU [Bryobacteraceae bacterium]
MNEPTVVILAAGLGTRMRSNKAKVLHEAGGDTLLNHVLRAAATLTSPEQTVVVIGHQAAEVKGSVITGGVRFAEQTEQKGTGHALLCASREIQNRDGVLLILNGDGPLLKPATLACLLEAQKTARVGGHVVTTDVENPEGYGRIVRDEEGNIAAIVEQKSARPHELAIHEINTGVYIFDAGAFWNCLNEIQPNDATGEYYLTDMVEILSRHGHPVRPFLVKDETELLGINTRVELAVADGILRARKNEELMLSGVTIENPSSVLIDAGVTVGAETTIGANVQLRGTTRIGERCTIGAGSILRDCILEDDVTLFAYVVAQDSTIGKGAQTGPFSRLRQKARVGERVHIGNFVELKNTSMDNGAKANHLAYLGDASIGERTNVGAGTITCNYDGARKHPTVIESNVFVGSNATLVAPIRLGEGSYIAAGSVITGDVEADALAIGRERQTVKPGWAKKRREAKEPSSGDKRSGT